MLSRYNELEEALAAKAAEGLSRLLAHLREEDERRAAAALEALKPVGVPVRETHTETPYASLPLAAAAVEAPERSGGPVSPPLPC